jgi:hypothetical protein
MRLNMDDLLLEYKAQIDKLESQREELKTKQRELLYKYIELKKNER